MRFDSASPLLTLSPLSSPPFSHPYLHLYLLFCEMPAICCLSSFKMHGLCVAAYKHIWHGDVTPHHIASYHNTLGHLPSLLISSSSSARYECWVIDTATVQPYTCRDLSGYAVQSTAVQCSAVTQNSCIHVLPSIYTNFCSILF